MPPRKRRQRTETQITDLATWTESLSDSLILCRDIGHQWRPARAWIEDHSYGRVMRCYRCKTERHQVLTLSGHVVANRYDYTDGYLTPKGSGSFTPDDRDNLRLESVLRLISKEG